MKKIAIALAPSLAFVNSAQAENNLPEVEIVKTVNQRRHFRRIAVNNNDTELAKLGRMNPQLKAAFHRDEPRQLQNPVHDQTVAR